MRYRMLKLDEVAVEGDEWADGDGYWQPVHMLAGETARGWRKKMGGYPGFKFRRPIKQKRVRKAHNRQKERHSRYKCTECGAPVNVPGRCWCCSVGG